MGTRKKYNDNFVHGFSKEQEFANILAREGYEVTPSTNQQDMTEHWDLKFNKSHKVDVKALKKIRRADQYVQEDYHYIEIKNVVGKPGWCYGNEVEMFAFETLDYWILVNKLDLQKLVAEKVQKIWSKVPVPYQMYRRNGRKDIITLVKTIDLLYICINKFKK